MGPSAKRKAFTLVELLVIIAIVAILIGLLVPAVQKIRESANQAQCANNLKQFGVALHSFASTNNTFPPAATYSGNTATVNDLNGLAAKESWAVAARLLPYLEQSGVVTQINLISGNVNGPRDDSDPAVTAAVQLRNPIFICPSDPNNVGVVDGTNAIFPINYGFNFGTWFIYNWNTGRQGDGAFLVTTPMNSPSGLTPTAFVDGLSNTLASAEVKAQTLGISTSTGLASAALPSVNAIQTFGTTLKFATGSTTLGTGHREWGDARIVQSGFTTAFPPNTLIPCVGTSGNGGTVGVTYDVDFNSFTEGNGSTYYPTSNISYAAVTARSYHSSCVNVLLMDGSVRPVSNGITATTWQALGTRAGAELIPNY